ncbi:hypothetical protein BGZ46_006756 [Entomortierella lignicola]|nr:hypothetical protein BGZ46_006756 [Entomortierella lignicola]
MTSIRDICNAVEEDKSVPDIEMESASRPATSSTRSLPPSSSSSSSNLPMTSMKYHHEHSSGAPPRSYSPPLPPPPHSQRSHYTSHSPHHSQDRHHHYSHQHRPHSDHYGRYPRYSDSNEPQLHDNHRSHHPPLPPPHAYDPYYDGRSSFSSSSYHHPSEHHQRQDYHKDPYQHHHRHQYHHYPQGDYAPSHSSSRSSRSSQERRMSVSQSQRDIPRYAEEQRPSHSHSSSKADIIPKREDPPPQHRPLRQRLPEDDQPISKARIKIVQQPLHARMCGFGEKDRRPIDPPPIVQLFLDDDPTYNEPRAPPKPIKPIKPRKKRDRRKGGKPGRKPGKKAQEAAAAAAAAVMAAAAAEAEAVAKKQEQEERGSDGESDNEGDESESNDGDSDDEDAPSDQSDSKMEEDESVPREKKSPKGSRSAKGTKSSEQEPVVEKIEIVKEPTPPPPPAPKRRGRPPRDKSLAGLKHSRDGKPENESDSEIEWPRYEGGAEALRIDPLFVLHVSLWSEDGSEVRSMIATPGQSDPPKLTRILMGAVVVSPILLNDEHGKPGWYFSFPDLSIRTEGTYTLKFSLMRFASFDFDDCGGSYASTLIAEEISQPFSVFSAKKFPGMTESTELSKAFAKQGLKIPIRNDLRVRKNTEKDSM